MARLAAPTPNARSAREGPAAGTRRTETAKDGRAAGAAVGSHAFRLAVARWAGGRAVGSRAATPGDAAGLRMRVRHRGISPPTPSATRSRAGPPRLAHVKRALDTTKRRAWTRRTEPRLPSAALGRAAGAQALPSRCPCDWPVGAL